MNVEQKLVELANNYGKAAQDHFEYRLGLCLRHCESPIEQLMLAALIAAADPECCGSRGLPGVWDQRLIEVLREQFMKGQTWNGVMARHCTIAPQFQIEEYRVDFCLLFAGDYEDRAVFHMVVECDGHEWHERTADQAQRDKARDRAIQAAGFQVMRFTGREIWQDALKCAREVYEAAAKEMYRRTLGPNFEV